jgi:hypothetical protein
MLTRPIVPVGAPWTCARCHRKPGHADDLEAFAAGYTSSRRDLHGCEPFVICAACRRVEAGEVYEANVAYWLTFGLVTREQVSAMLGERPA